MGLCHFCEYQDNGKKLNYNSKYFYIVVPREPAEYGHVLIVSKKLGDKHIKDITDPELSSAQLTSMITATQLVARWMKNEFNDERTIEKVYVLTQCDTPDSHFHFHLKPRYRDEKNRGDVFLCLKELEEARWITEKSQKRADKNQQGLKRLLEIELGLCKHKAMIDDDKWARTKPERKAFVHKMEEKLNTVIDKHRSELDDIGKKE